MGCGTNVVCKICKKDYYCGYGSYSAQNERKARIPEECKSHETVSYTEDYTRTVENEDGTTDLWLSHMWDECVLVEDIGSYEGVSLVNE